MAGTGRRPRISVRGMLVGVAVSALASAVALNWFPVVLRRRRVEAILAEQYRAMVAPNSAPIQSFDRLGEQKPSALKTLRSSSRDVARRLLKMVETPGDPGGGFPLEWRPSAHLPGVWAADRLGEWVVEADDDALGREVTAALFDLAAGGRLLPEVESASLSVLLLELAPRLGLDAGRRAEAWAKVRALATGGSSKNRLELWARLAAEPGDRDDLLALLDLAGRNRELARVVATSSAFSECRWPGLVGPVSRLAACSDDPRAFLDFAAFVASREGREALFAYAADDSHPPPERRRAIHRLKREPAGVAFLLEACDDPARRPTVAEFFGRDHARQLGDPPPYVVRPTFPYAREAADPSDPRPELHQLLRDLGRVDDPWPRLLRAIDRESWRSDSLAAGLTDDAADRLALVRSAHARDLLLVAAPGLHPSGALADAPSIAWKDWFAALERFPDADDRFDADFRMATLPTDCIGVLARIARSPTGPHREAALRLLVSRTERVDEVGPLIECLAGGAGPDADRISTRDVESLRALRRRFAVDFGWDRAAWRSWWGREMGVRE